MDRPQFLSSIVGWLRKGYPNGVPSGDFVPLVALLRRRLTEDEVQSIAAQLVRGEPEVISAVDAGVEIMKVTDELPSDSDLERVRALLVAGGWPFDNEFGGDSDGNPDPEEDNPGENNGGEDDLGEGSGAGGDRP